MAETTTLSAEARDRAGKGSARAARKAGRIPAVIYGDKKEAVSITLDANSFRKLISQPGIFSKILSIRVGDDATDVLPRDIQFHPVTDIPLHVDFLRVSRSSVVTVEVPVEFINEELSPGIKTGGVLNIVRHEVEVDCPAISIPEKFVIDLTGREVGDSIHISEVDLPADVTPTITDRDFTIATIAAPTVVEETETVAEGEEGAEGAAEGDTAGDASGNDGDGDAKADDKTDASGDGDKGGD